MAQPNVPRSGAILLVEDCDDMRTGVSQLLELNGFTVDDVADGAGAIDQLNANPTRFALILLDLLLPGSISGGDVRARQLADPLVADVPTIVVSAYEAEEVAQARLKPDVWLEKPFRGEQLLAVVRLYVRPHEQESGIRNRESGIIPSLRPVPCPPGPTLIPGS